MSNPPRRRPIGLGGRPIGSSSPLLGGPVEGAEARHAPDPDASPPAFDPSADELAAGPPSSLEATVGRTPSPEQLRELLPEPEPGRDLDDWGRSERVMAAADPLLNFYYRYWFRVSAEGVGNVPSSGGALLVCNHSGALPPDAPMIMQAIRNEHPSPRALYMLGEHWFKGYPGVSMLAAKLGVVPAHPANAQRLLGDEGRLALVFPEGMKGSGKVLWQRYRLRRFGRGGFVRTALRAGVPIVPVALVGGEEAMPIFAHMRSLQRMTGLIYAPLNHAFPHFGPLAALMYMPAKFRIRFLEPLDVAALPDGTIDDSAAVQGIAEEIRARIQGSLDDMLAERDSVWLG
ncbi:MAG: acyltransferase family protein [Solirubrobacterales bacterium]|nr:acyltransferase family protein [Solirubrobacterales bacterium]